MLLRIELITLAMIRIASQIETRKAMLVISILIIIVREGVTGITIILKSTKIKGNDLLSRSVI